MLKYCVKQWDKNKDKLEEAFRTQWGWNTCEYKDLVVALVQYVLNDADAPDWEHWDYKRITEIDNGDYQGTLLYLIPRCCYQPCAHDYLMTYVEYGSCSGCDTLMGIQGYRDDALTDKQVSDFMTLCKDLLTSIIKPYNRGWRCDTNFEEMLEEEAQ